MHSQLGGNVLLVDTAALVLPFHIAALPGNEPHATMELSQLLKLMRHVQVFTKTSQIKGSIDDLIYVQVSSFCQASYFMDSCIRSLFFRKNMDAF